MNMIESASSAVKIPPRVVDINAGTPQNYYNYIAHCVTPEAYDFKKILEW